MGDKPVKLYKFYFTENKASESLSPGFSHISCHAQDRCWCAMSPYPLVDTFDKIASSLSVPLAVGSCDIAATAFISYRLQPRESFVDEFTLEGDNMLFLPMNSRGIFF